MIHATALAVDPIAAAFQRHWPEARRRCAAGGATLGLIATFEASIGSMAAELRLMASERFIVYR